MTSLRLEVNDDIHPRPQDIMCRREVRDDRIAAEGNCRHIQSRPELFDSAGTLSQRETRERDNGNPFGRHGIIGYG